MREDSVLLMARSKIWRQTLTAEEIQAVLVDDFKRIMELEKRVAELEKDGWKKYAAERPKGGLRGA